MPVILAITLGASALAGAITGALAEDGSASAPGGATTRPAAAPTHAPALSGKGDIRGALSRGHEAYGQGDYLGALEAYRSVLRAGYESPELYLGLGSASYRLGRLGWAVYWFERGRRIAPGDPDLRTNLESVVAETRDRATAEDGSRFLSSLTALQDRVSSAGAARGLTVAWFLFAAWLAARLAFPGGITPGPAASRAFRWAGVLLGAMLVVAVAGTLVKLAQASGAPEAVVVAEEMPVRSNPDPEATVEFTLHAGTRMRLGRTDGDFREVVYSDKLHGWGAMEGIAELSDLGVRTAAARER